MGLSEAMLFAFAATIICAFAIAEKIIDIDFEQFMPKNLKKAKMKRILALVLALCMVFAFAACGKDPVDPVDPVDPNNPPRPSIPISPISLPRKNN